MIIDLVKVIFQGVLLTGRMWLEMLIMPVKQTYSVDSIKRTVHLGFHGLFTLLKILFTISKQYF